ncbi:MAG: hypothetical protein R3C44_00870 [Chloroflexota bacterium]
MPTLPPSVWPSMNGLQAHGSTVSAEYLPPDVVPRAYSADRLNSGQRQRPVVLDGEVISAEPVRHNADSQIVALHHRVRRATVLLPTLYWPGWAATGNSAPLTLSAQPGSGLMRRTCPPGKPAWNYLWATHW